MRKQIGDFHLNVWEDGFPVWVVITYDNVEIKIHHDELHDLQYLVECAKRAVAEKLPSESNSPPEVQS